MARANYDTSLFALLDDFTLQGIVDIWMQRMWRSVEARFTLQALRATCRRFAALIPRDVCRVDLSYIIALVCHIGRPDLLERLIAQYRHDPEMWNRFSDSVHFHWITMRQLIRSIDCAIILRNEVFAPDVHIYDLVAINPPWQERVIHLPQFAGTPWHDVPEWICRQDDAHESLARIMAHHVITHFVRIDPAQFSRLVSRELLRSSFVYNAWRKIEEMQTRNDIADMNDMVQIYMDISHIYEVSRRDIAVVVALFVAKLLTMDRSLAQDFLRNLGVSYLGPKLTCEELAVAPFSTQIPTQYDIKAPIILIPEHYRSHTMCAHHLVHECAQYIDHQLAQSNAISPYISIIAAAYGLSIDISSRLSEDESIILLSIATWTLSRDQLHDMMHKFRANIEVSLKVIYMVLAIVSHEVICENPHERLANFIEFITSIA